MSKEGWKGEREGRREGEREGGGGRDEEAVNHMQPNTVS